ncbi:MAG: ImmA/IrrE family metallo-endopeptidase [Clostridia bacterium]|nr:ImmA/IrrE family metallo-endopeptidase [Clostridia bacterium]
MYSFYGIYSSCRDAAWRTQLDFNVNALPVQVIGIARMAGIRVLKNDAVSELKPGELGVSIYDGSSWTIIYDERLSVPDARITVAHELGHIFLGHAYKYAGCRFDSDRGENGSKLKIEREADMFALRLLTPACVLHELHITDAHGIAALCGIPLAAARDRARRMKVLENRCRFYTSPLERQVIGCFDDFVHTFYQ